MIKKVLFFVVSLLLMSLILSLHSTLYYLSTGLPIIKPSSSRIIYIDGHNPVYEDGSMEHPFNTVQEGVNAATSGDTVKVAGNYTYYESILIDKPLTLTKWAEKNTLGPTVDGSRSEKGYVLGINSSNVEVSGFTIEGYAKAPHYGILCMEGGSFDKYLSGISIKQNVIRKHDYGVFAEKACRNIVVANNVFEDVLNGIRVFGETIESRIANNVIRGLGVAGVYVYIGIELPWDCESIVMAENDIEGFDHGIDMTSAGNATVIGNSVLHCGSGIAFAYTRNTMVADNNLSECRYGMNSWLSENNTLINNCVLNCTTGIWLGQSSGNAIVHNDFGLLGSAIGLHEAHANNISANSIWASSMLLDSSDSEGNRFWQNDVFDSTSPSSNERNSTNYYVHNYWSDYDGTDSDGDGYGNSAYRVAEPDTFDQYPLAVPHGPIPISWKDARYDCRMFGNAVVSDIHFNNGFSCIEFNVAVAVFGGWWNLTIPRTLLDGQFKVLLDNTAVQSILSWNRTHTSVYFTFNQTGKYNVKVVADIAAKVPLTDFPDLNGDGKINIVDVAIVATQFGKELNDP